MAQKNPNDQKLKSRGGPSLIIERSEFNWVKHFQAAKEDGSVEVLFPTAMVPCGKRHYFQRELVKVTW